MTLFGRYFLLFTIAIGWFGNAAIPSARAQDADAVEAVTSAIEEDGDEEETPTIAQDEIPAIPEEEEEEEEEEIPYIVEDEYEVPTIAEGNTASTPSTTAGNDGGLQKLLMEFLTLNWQLVAGLVATVILLPLLSRVFFRRKNEVAKYAAASMAMEPAVLPEARPADPLALDTKQSFTPSGMVGPVADEATTPFDNLTTQYAGSSVTTDVPDFPSPPTTDGEEDSDAILFDDAVTQNIELDDDINSDQPLFDLVTDKKMQPGDMDSSFEIDDKQDPAHRASANTEQDIVAFEAANASDPFEVDVEDDAVAMDEVGEEELLIGASEESDDESLAAEVVTEEFTVTGNENDAAATDDATTAGSESLAEGLGFGAGVFGLAEAAGAHANPAAVQPTSAPANQAAEVVEIRIAAIQQALAQEQHRTAQLDQEQRELKDLVAQLRGQLAMPVKSAPEPRPAFDGLDTTRHAMDGDAIVRLQGENSELTLKLQQEQAQRQASEIELRTLESTVMSLDARLRLVNTERDNLAKMLYDAKQADRKPR